MTEPLIPREIAVAEYRACGLGNKQIAGLLDARFPDEAPHTFAMVKHAADSVMDKLGADSMIEACSKLTERGVIKPSNVRLDINAHISGQAL